MLRRFRLIRGRPVARQEPPLTESVTLPRPFEEALLGHLDRLFALALRLVGGQREVAEDLVQETCLHAFRNYEQLRSPANLHAWFFRILVRTHINAFHRQRREPPIVDVELSDAWLEGASVTLAPATPEEHLFGQLLDVEVQQALDTLPVEFRAVVWLADVEELSYKEIAEILQCSPGTVASRRYRGHHLLRERLREYARGRGW
ncbi:MAG: sigma-70 family RNA polymerase sigma factor [Acidobacteria bacterium]|nr:sigma-70 family RNA polymerase sigma factor [Acidobacteriota bacterium]